MKTVKQKHDNGCGAACVAMLAGITYDEAAALLYPSGRSRRLGTAPVRAALEKLNRKPSTGRRQPFGLMRPQDLKSDALVFVMMEQDGEEYRHWMVWDATAKKLRNPYPRNHPCRPTSYLLVE